MAWPFPDAQHGSDACVVRYERDQACLGPWRGEERKVAIMLLVVPVAVFVWMVWPPETREGATRASANIIVGRHRTLPDYTILLDAFTAQAAER